MWKVTPLLFLEEYFPSYCPQTLGKILLTCTGLAVTHKDISHHNDFITSLPPCKNDTVEEKTFGRLFTTEMNLMLLDYLPLKLI